MKGYDIGEYEFILVSKIIDNRSPINGDGQFLFL